MKRYFRIIIIISTFVFTIYNISDVTNEINNSISKCINIIIPSLFITMAISDYIIKTRCLSYISHAFKPIAKILGMHENLVPIFIISNVGGYPVGIKMLSELVKQKELTKKQAGIIASYCFGAGPAFIIGSMGTCVYQNDKIGIAIYLSIVISNIFGAIIINRAFKINRIILSEKSDGTEPSSAIIESVESASKSLFSMCSIIVAFSVISVALEKIIFEFKLSNNDSISIFLRSITDVTNIVKVNAKSYAILPLVTVIIALGGCCVWLQCAKISDHKIDFNKLIFLRIILSAISPIVFYLFFYKICAEYLSVFATTPRIIVNIDNFAPSFCLIIMIFLFFLKKRLAFHKKV